MILNSRMTISISFGLMTAKVLLLVLICFVWVTEAKAGNDKAATVKEYNATVLKQRSKFSGFSELYLAQPGMKIELPQQNLVIISLRNSEDITVINTLKRSYYQGKAAKWVYNNTASALLSPSDATQLRLGARSAGIIKGLPCLNIQLNGEIYQRIGSVHKRSWCKGMVSNASITCMPDGTAWPAAATITERLFVTPKTGLLPLQMNLHNENKSPSAKPTLELLQVEKKKVKSTDYAVPAGFKKSDNASVLFPETKQSLLDELLR